MHERDTQYCNSISTIILPFEKRYQSLSNPLQSNMISDTGNDSLTKKYRHLAESYFHPHISYDNRQVYHINLTSLSIVTLYSHNSLRQFQWMGSGIVGCLGNCGKVKSSAKYQETDKQASVPFLAGFGLCISDLQNKGDYQFPLIQSAETQLRGGFPYYQPVLGTRYGIKVMGVYGQDSWLLMDHSKGEWAIAFHGIRNPENPINGKPAFRCIMDGRKNGLMLRPGENQAYSDKMCANYPSERVGVGVYLSPHSQTSLLDYTTPVTMAGQTYHIVLICRVKPDKVRICADMQDYWVVKQPKHIRPYGIVLFTPSQFKQIKNQRASKGGTHQRFNWQAARQTYEEFIAQ